MTIKGLILLFLLLSIGLITTLYGTSYLSTVRHEEAHVQINKYYGMESTYTVTIDYTGVSGLTTPDRNDSFFSEDARNFAYLGHSINEAIGYQLKPYLNVMLGFMFLQTTILIFIFCVGGEK
jgi:hypothetical protein